MLGLLEHYNLFFANALRLLQAIYKNLLRTIAFPEPVLKYFSNSIALSLVSTAIYDLNLAGKNLAVEGTLPSE